MKYMILILLLLISHTEPTKMTHEKLYDKLVENEVMYPDIAFAQSVLETGSFTSKLYKNQNNLFGMKVAKKRETTATNKSGYAKYDSPDDSIRDYYLFQQYVMRKKVMTRKEYLSYIGRNYAESGNYLKKVNNIIQRYSYIFAE